MFEGQDNKLRLWKKFLEDGLPFGLFVGIALIGVAIWFASLTIREYQKISNIKTWQKAECEITASSVDKGAGKRNSDLFVVRYKYTWQGKDYEGQCFHYGYNGDSIYYPDAQELAAKYKTGEKTNCFVNPDSPQQAALQREEKSKVWFLIVPVFMATAGVRYIRRAIKDFVAPAADAELPFQFTGQTQLTPQTDAIDLFWKWSLRIGLIIAIFAAGWFVFFVAIFFVLVPYLFVSAGLRTVCAGFSKELAETAAPQDATSYYQSTETQKLFFPGEKIIIAAGACFFLIVEGLWLWNLLSRGTQEGKEPFTVFGIIFSAFFTFFLSSFLTFGIINALRRRRSKKFLAQFQAIDAGRRFSLFSLLSFAAACIAILGVFGFLMGFVCAVLVVPGPPGIIASIKLPVAEPQGIAIAPDGRIVCLSSAYQRIQIYDPNGRFEKGWFVNAAKSSHLVIDNSGRIRLAAYEIEYFYDFNGVVVEKKTKKYNFESFQSEFSGILETSTYDAKGNDYVFEHPSLCPYLVKISRDGGRQIIIKDPAYLWFLYGPFPAWLTAAAGGLTAGLLGYIEKLVKKNRPDQRFSTSA